MGRTSAYLVIVSWIGLGAGPAWGTQPPDLLSKLHASDGSPADWFGSEVALDGDVAVVTARGADNDQGAVYVFRRTSFGTWPLEQKLVTSGAAGELGFKWSLSVDGDTLAVGRPSWSLTGPPWSSVYVFRRNTSGFWEEKAPLGPPSPDHTFGYSVTLEGDWLLCGSLTDSDKGHHAGATYAFKYDSNTAQWLLAQKLYSPAPSSMAYFGRSVDADQDVLVIGEDAGGPLVAGQAHVFRRATSDVWVHEAILQPSDGQQWDHFGESVAITGEEVIVGSSEHPPNESGAAYVFVKTPSGPWVESAKLVPQAPLPGQGFGIQVTWDGVRAVIGTERDAAYVFESAEGGGWTEGTKFVAADVETDDQFGRRVALSEGRCLVASQGDDDLGLNAGAAYVYDVEPPPFKPYGLGCAGSGGVTSKLALTGDPTPGGAVSVEIAEGVGGGSAVLFFGLQPAALPVGFDCLLLVAPLLPAILGPIPLFPIGAQGPGAGSLTIGGVLPTSVTPGTITVQAFVVDTGVAAGFSTSNGVEFSIQ